MKYPNMVDPTEKDMEQLGAIRNMLDRQAQQQAAHQQEQQQTYPIFSEEVYSRLRKHREYLELHPDENPEPVYESKSWTWGDSIHEWIGLIFQLLVWAFIALGILLVICPFR
jgi:uncharacterized membrane protein